MRQKLCRRLEELERISAAAAAHRERMKPRDRGVLDELIAKVQAWHAVPENQKWLAEQPPDYLHRRVQSLRAELQERAYGHSRPVQKGGFR
jgi:hypothetical protein